MHIAGRYLKRFAAAWLAAAGVTASPHSAAADEVLVLTALPATYEVGTALADGTGIQVQNIPERGRRMNALPDLLERRADRFNETFAQADAVITIGKLWRDDPLYTAARAVNIRVIDIDATKPWSATLEGIAVTLEPGRNAPWEAADAPTQPRSPSVYFWLSPSNGARMADIVARDLMRLSPPDSTRIEQNLVALRRDLLGLKLEYELKFAELADLTVFALADEFVYLTNDFGLYVDGYFVKQDIDWSERDLERFESYLRDRRIGVVIHKWEPAEPIRAAIEAAGARLAVLDVIDAGVVDNGRLAAHAYSTLLRTDLAALFQALSAAQDQNR